MLDTKIQIQSENFDGPLALLLLLIQKEEMDIQDLDLTKITGQYLSYLAQLQEYDFNVAGDYLYLAATLVLLKSKRCLTEKEELELSELSGDSELNITSQSELVRRLEELQRFKRLSTGLMNLTMRGRDVFVKPRVNKKKIVDSILTPQELSSLTDAMMEIIAQSQRRVAIVKKDKISIKAKLEEFKTRFIKGDEIKFKDILKEVDGGDKMEIIITFISLLELARLGKITIFQHQDSGEIYTRVVADLDNFDVRQADGFDEEEETKKEETEVLQ